MALVRVEALVEFIDKESGERRHPGDQWDTGISRALGLENGGFIRRLDDEGNPLAESYPWGEPREDRWLETADVLEDAWDRVVACLNIWNDLEALKETYETWYPYVDKVIAVDGAYKGAPVQQCWSTDGTVEFLSSLDKVTLISAPEERFWDNQIEKRNEYFKRGEPGDLMFVVDADEYVHHAERLQTLPKFEVGWVPYEKSIYHKRQNFPRLFDARIDPRYNGRHYWIEGNRGYVTDCQDGGFYDHAFIPIRIDNTNNRDLRDEKRRRQRRLILTNQSQKESQIGDTQVGGRESLRIVQLTSLDPGMVVFRLHSAINACSPHESVMASSIHDRPYEDPYQWDLKEDRELIRAAIRECDIIHCHMSYQDFERLGVPTSCPVIMHHHGTMYRESPEVRNKRDAQKASVRLVSNPELLQYGENLHFLPNPVPVERYFRMRKRLYEPDSDGYIRIGHSPSKRHLKGTNEFLDVVEELQESGYRVKSVLIEDMTHADSLRLKAEKCELFFDSFFLGMQCSGIEAGAMGIPVIAGDEDNRAYYREKYEVLPYRFANTKDQLKTEIFNLVDVHDREKEGQWVLDFIRENHDYSAVVSQYLDILDDELNWRERLSLGQKRYLET